MKIIIDRNLIIKTTVILITFLSTILVPIINYIMFINTISEGIDLGNLEKKYSMIIIAITILGIGIMVCSYSFFRYPKYSVKRGFVSLFHSLLDLIFLILFAQMSVINIFSVSDCVICSGYRIYGTSLDLSGVFILLIVILSLFTIKNLYDLIDFKINENYYDTLRREHNYRFKQDNQKLLKCSNCGYMCYLEWKECPICKKSIKL